ncbi:MAG: murein L,D-transpeptidase catalytic domain family protein [Chlorobium sp.]|uniref:murein L,D-transpeptidase catalytic domain family protein n=1 Tax=Chlorobium sp. TaxID=1095 RepID=UPI0025BA2516|nr:murein L,D-transpeptidase catalytic domain family protein [Chlorobium sp.]MCF8216069.1 murein L,D-transpeptidase catalytic domain family protein [Chlorobium sp.]MCF8270970.1 murein L,D-transpeptidase catalytic domain family protein [Chlorobium sp.]MCF8287384.1 murein L,D-transpeptidase catalytic domain family protein [Chlorobium sp.]MCF8290883.1 murein L,D-transpeptidase catalytic domain family protein [Chlorobium sp.]MCF8384978.1 murein L,D-transpeptidase catalytic domain family protein [C
MIRSIVMLLFVFLLLPAPGQAYPFQQPSLSKRISTLSQSSELRYKIDPKVLNMALTGYHSLKEQGKVSRDGILTVIDFNKPSVDERMFIIDINRGRLLYSGLVAHGSGSGENYAYDFSNTPGSHKSSLGFYTTGMTYDGKHGYSLRLRGMEPGINDKAESRSIVIHGANYVSYDFIRRHGRLGRSQGCPALPFDSFQHVIDLIKDGSCLFIYHRNADYSSSSRLVNPDFAAGTSRVGRSAS